MAGGGVGDVFPLVPSPHCESQSRLNRSREIEVDVGATTMSGFLEVLQVKGRAFIPRLREAARGTATARPTTTPLEE